ncbi:hypothetical protein [Vibrio owensii]|uniref:hypothetical protein n=1 Tax=Vibrio owensii TaxID=696485 RepID=UPI0018F15CC4|nr:hypothetical protein [Vibrio owensii]
MTPEISNSCKVSESESKKLCESWLSFILETQENYPFCVANNFDEIKEELINYNVNSTHSEVLWNDYFGERFGFVVGGIVLYSDGKVIEPEYYFYSSKIPTRRLACTLNMVLTKHILERLIFRLNLRTFAEFKEAIVGIVTLPTLFSTVDMKQVGVDTNYIVVNKDFTLFADMDDGITTFKTMISSEQYVPRQKEVIEYIINKVGQDYVGFTHYEVPRDIVWVDRVLKDTEVRMDPSLDLTVETLLPILCTDF